MKKKRYSWIFVSLILCSLLLFTSCSKTGGGFSFTKKKSDTSSIISGNGLTMDFMQGFPPNEMYAEDDAKIPVLVEITNKGDYNIKDSDTCFVEVGGFDKNIITMSEIKKDCGELNGKEFEEFQTLEFEGNIDKTKIKETYTPSIVANLCYAYKTQTSSQFCVSPSLYHSDIASSHSCTPSKSISFDNQRAPIVVSGADLKSASNKVYLTLHITNKGGGMVVDNEKLSSCPNSLKRNDIDYVGYTIDVKSANKIECTPDPSQGKKIKLINGKGRAVCSLTFDSGSAFETPIEVNLDYGYAKSISKKVKIVNPDNLFN